MIRLVRLKRNNGKAADVLKMSKNAILKSINDLYERFNKDFILFIIDIDDDRQYIYDDGKEIKVEIFKDNSGEYIEYNSSKYYVA